MEKDSNASPDGEQSRTEGQAVVQEDAMVGSCSTRVVERSWCMKQEECTWSGSVQVRLDGCGRASSWEGAFLSPTQSDLFRKNASWKLEGRESPSQQRTVELIKAEGLHVQLHR